jgi:cytosol aminopeptidase family protein
MHLLRPSSSHWHQVTLTMKALLLPALIGILLALSSGRGSAQQAPVPEKIFEGANHLRIHVKEVAPGGQASSVQVICYLKHRKTGDTTLAAVSDFDRELGGIVKLLRDGDQFEGYPLETLYFGVPKDTIKAQGVLLVGVGDEQELSLQTMRNVGTVALRNALLLNASSVSFAAALQDQNVKKLDVGDVAGAVVTGALLAYDTEKRLQDRGLLPQHSIEDWFYEAGPAFFARTVQGVDEALKKANVESAERKPLK